MSRIEVAGAKQLMRKLQRMQKTEVAKAVRKGSRAASKMIAARAVEDAPQRTGGVRKAIKVRALPRSRKWTGTQVTMKVAGNPAYWGAFVELGTKKQKAQHFIKRATESVRSAAGAVFVETIQAGIVAAFGR